MSLKENKIKNINSEKSINLNKNKSRNLKKLNKYNTIGYISYSSKLPNLSNLSNKNRNSLVKNNFSKTAINIKNNLNYYTPKISSSKFSKINTFSPLNNNKIRINYFKEIPNKKINFSLKKSNSIQNLKIQSNNNFKRTINNYNYNSIYNNNNNNTNLTRKKKFSNYYYKSKNSLYSSENIFNHYINESENDKIIPEKYFYKGGSPKPKKEIDEFDKLNINYHRRLEEIKCNKSIAFKKDFDIMNYQSTLIKLISKKVSDNYVLELQDRYMKFNENLINGQRAIVPKGRFTVLAEKIKYNIPSFLYEKIKKLDKDKLMSRYNYFKQMHKNIHSNVEKLKSKREKLKALKNKSKKKNINLNNSF